MTNQATTIIETIKALELKGHTPYVAVFGGCDLIIWASETDSENDNGANAVARYDIDAQTIEDLGTVDFNCDWN